MANLRNRLSDIFHSYLKRLDDEKKNATVGSYHRPIPCQQRLNFDDNTDFQGIIYFYEWSDANRTPKTFYTLDAFERFLNTSLIFMASYQKELIRNIHNPYIACRKDGKDIIIKCSYESLKHALETEDKSTNPFRSPSKGSEDKEPYGVAITRPPIKRPPMYIELENRWDEMHPEVGGCWGW